MSYRRDMLDQPKFNLIRDGQSLEGAFHSSYPGGEERPIKVYDDGFGPLFIFRETMGIVGIVRAQTWEDAYSIVEDEFLASATFTEMKESADDYGVDLENGTPEGFGYRPNGRNSMPGDEGIYQEDLNGSSLDLLVPGMLKDWNIRLVIRDED